MKTSKRENVMLMILFFLILIFIYYDFLISPRINEIKRLSEEKYLLEGHINELENNRNEDKLNKINVQGLSKEMKLQSVDIFNNIEEEDVINIIDEIINNSRINIDNISIMSEDIDSGEATGGSIPRICVTLSYRDTLDELMRFISGIENYYKEIIISNLSITGGEVFEVMGSISLELYYIPTGNHENNKGFYQGSRRKNPFIKTNSTR